MRHLIALVAFVALLTLAACANPVRFGGGMAEPAMEPALEATPAATTDCQPDDDGIGGTGCPVE